MANSWWIKCSVLFLLFSALVGVSLSDEPTFTQCKTHIEAAIKKGLTPEDIAAESSAIPESVPDDDVTTTISHLADDGDHSPDAIVDSIKTEEAVDDEDPAELTEPADDPTDEQEESVETGEEEDEHSDEDQDENDDDDDDQVAEAQEDEAETEATTEEAAEPEQEAAETAEPEPEAAESTEEGESAEAEEETESEEPETAEPNETEESAEEPAEEPVEEESAAEEPAAEEPTAEEPTAEEPATEEPATEEQSTEEPAAEEPATEEPVAEEPAAEEPTAEEPVAQESADEEPAAEEPVTEEPAAEASATEEAAEPEEEAVAEETAEPEAPEPVADDPAEGIIEEEPEVRRSRDHIGQVLGLNDATEDSMLRTNVANAILKELKSIIETAVRPLENIFKYNDVSNRNFGDAEIFSKPLVLFLGPWSGGKSSLINYLVGTEYTQNALKTGAEPSATFFQILMFGEQEELLDGTQLAADWTFSGLQKFGQAFIDRLRGKRLPNKLLQKANIVEVPGILEVRKQVDRPYPFNDVVQWFIDRADIIFVVYDPTKLDTGLEHEALFDQLKGRQSQVRVLLNKADSVTQEELLLIQNNLVWNLSPLMASALPPTLYAGSFWSRPYKPDAPVRLLQAHEKNMLTDLREAIDNVVENTIAEARRHAVRVRNHAKMVDCYLTTFYNHKGYFGNNKAIADEIIENPHAYHIFEGLSTLNNISRYDLPDAEVYKDFFQINPLPKFKPLASTCTFFRGCPLDKLDTAIAYELPELVGKYKKRLQNLPKKGATKS